MFKNLKKDFKDLKEALFKVLENIFRVRIIYIDKEQRKNKKRGPS